MIQIQLINSVIACERRLKFEAERRNNHRFEPHVNYPGTPQTSRKGGVIEWVRIIELEEEGRKIIAPNHI